MQFLCHPGYAFNIQAETRTHKANDIVLYSD